MRHFFQLITILSATAVCEVPTSLASHFTPTDPELFTRWLATHMPESTIAVNVLAGTPYMKDFIAGHIEAYLGLDDEALESLDSETPATREKIVRGLIAMTVLYEAGMMNDIRDRADKFFVTPSRPLESHWDHLVMCGFTFAMFARSKPTVWRTLDALASEPLEDGTKLRTVDLAAAVGQYGRLATLPWFIDILGRHTG